MNFKQWFIYFFQTKATWWNSGQMEQRRTADLGPGVEPLVCQHTVDQPVPSSSAVQPQGIRDRHL